MNILSHNDFLALNGAIGEIYAARDLESLYGTMFSSIQGLVPGELHSCSEIGFQQVRFPKVVSAAQDQSGVTRKFLPASNSRILERPSAPLLHTEKAYKTTDFHTKCRFKSTVLYNEYSRHPDVENQIGFSIPISSDKVALIALSRKNRDFSERDKLILTLLRPHLIGALRNVMELSQITLERNLLQKGAESESRGVILFKADGKVVCISLLAKEMLESYLDVSLTEGALLPARLLQWFQSEAIATSAPRASQGTIKAGRVERPPLIIEKAGKYLRIKLLSDFTTGDYILLIIERDSSRQWQKLQACGLSGRETEVLLWLAKGKTNLEIAAILGMGKRTAEKHLEHIFVKLGVETRAAAAALMRRELPL